MASDKLSESSADFAVWIINAFERLKAKCKYLRALLVDCIITEKENR